MSIGWLFTLLGIGAFCVGVGMAASVLWVGRESNEGRHA